jgi:hypothetical protein
MTDYVRRIPPPPLFRVISWRKSDGHTTAEGDFVDSEEAVALAKRIYDAGAHEASVFEHTGRVVYHARMGNTPPSKPIAVTWLSGSQATIKRDRYRRSGK